MCLCASLRNKVPVSLGTGSPQRLSEDDHQQTYAPNGLAKSSNEDECVSQAQIVDHRDNSIAESETCTSQFVDQ